MDSLMILSLCYYKRSSCLLFKNCLYIKPKLLTLVMITLSLKSPSHEILSYFASKRSGIQKHQSGRIQPGDLSVSNLPLYHGRGIVIRYNSVWRPPKSWSEYTTTQHIRAGQNICWPPSTVYISVINTHITNYNFSHVGSLWGVSMYCIYTCLYDLWVLFMLVLLFQCN